MNAFLWIALYALAALSIAAMVAIVFWDRLMQAGGKLRGQPAEESPRKECSAYEGDRDGR